MPKVYSTLTSRQNYAIHEELPGGGTRIVKNIHINGGHGLTNTRGELLSGAVTEVSDEDLTLLKQDFSFKHHLKHGWLSIGDKTNVEAAISEHDQRDLSAPVTQSDVDALYDDGVIAVPVEEYKAEGKARARAKVE